MLLNVSKDVLHVVVVAVMMCAASVSVGGGGELHVHQWLVRKIFTLVVELWRVVRYLRLTLGHQVTVRKVIFVVWNLLGYLILQLGHFGPHLRINASPRIALAKDVSTLSCCPRLSVCHYLVILASLLNF